MSTTLSDFVNCWNETMPFPTRESDIKSPNEVTFRRLLICVLKQLFVDTNFCESMDGESGSRLRASRVRLVTAVNKFYKIACPGAKLDFCLMDLMKPNSKKTYAVLNYLLNYCVFIRHTYSSTIGSLKVKMNERDELRTTRNNIRKELEETKIKEENNIKMIKELDNKLPRQKDKNVESKEELNNLRNEITKLKEEFEKLEMDLIELKNELEKAKTLTVSDEEVQSIISTKEAVEKELEEQNQFTSINRQKLQDNSRAIKEASEITSMMDQVLVRLSGFDISEVKNLRKCIDQLKIDLAKLKSGVAQKKTQHEHKSHIMESKKNSIAYHRNKLADLKIQQSAKETALKKALKEKKNLHRKLSPEEAALSVTYKQLIEDRDRAYRLTANVMKQICSNLFEDD